MRLVLAMILAVSLGLLPINAHAEVATNAPTAAMSCHDMAGAGNAVDGDQAPADRMQACADHCLSQVNGHTSYTRQPGPSLVNAISAELVEYVDLTKLHYRDPPDPPPPRIYA